MPEKEGSPEEIGKGDTLPSVGNIIRSDNKRQFTLKTVLGDGGYGTVFECRDDASRPFALKAEKWSKSVLHIEANVLRAVNQKQCKHFCQLIDVGRVSNEYAFIVLTLLGPDLAKLRNDMPDRHFTLGTAVRVAIQTSSAIEELHKAGYINRDVKPGNFAIGNKQDDLHRVIFMFDFGLARKYIDRNGNVIPPRKEPGWRGTTRYGSLQAHLKLDLCRKDDYESWLYMMVEITKGYLPWRQITDRGKIHEAKLSVRTSARSSFFSGCPKQYDQLMTLLDKLGFESTPPYEQIVSILMECCDENNIKMSQKYDWEAAADKSVPVHTSVSRSGSKKKEVERPEGHEV